MKNLLLLLAVLLSGSLSAQYAPGELVVKFDQPSIAQSYISGQYLSQGHAEFNDLMNDLDIAEVIATGNRREGLTVLIRYESALDPSEVSLALQPFDIIQYAEPNFMGSGAGKGARMTTPNDEHFDRQWGLVNDGTFDLSPATADADIDMDAAWEIEQGSSNIIVASLDSGVKMDHPEFAGRIWQNQDEVDNTADSDSNGYADDVVGWDFANNDSDPGDDHGHGSNVTSIIGANANNDVGYAGVDWNCQLMILKILDSNNLGFYTWWADAIYYAVDNGAHVLNMSVGGSSYSQLLEDAVNYAHDNDVTIVACMMNENNSVPYYPSAFDATIAVGSTNANDERSAPFFWSASSGSCFGSHIDVCAPGNYVYGTNHISNTDYEWYWGGTSQATPHVAGLCALLLAQDGNLGPEDLRTILHNTAEDEVGDPAEDLAGWDQYHGHGRVNALDALNSIVSVEEIEANALFVYPNPAKQILNIQSEVGSALSIFSQDGRLVKTMIIQTPNFQIDISDLSAGLYTVTVQDKRGSNESKEILITR